MRTEKTAKNLIIGTVLTTAIALLGLIKIKVFLNYLGDEATGIYQLFNQIFSYISLVDAGLTSSILYSLYKPVSVNNTKKTNAILKGGRKFYNIIALIIIVIGVLISFKIDFFIADYTLPFWYIQVSFILFIIASASNYFVTTRKVILEARQNLYKVHLVVYISMLIKGILEIVLLLLNLKLMSLMILMLAISIIQNIIIVFVSKKDYPEISYNGDEIDTSFKKETKNLLAQKVASIVFNNTDVILISKYIGASSIIIYTSYMYIINSLQNVVKKIGSSSLAGFGNLLVTEKEKAKNIFYEYNSMCFYLATIICVPLLLVINQFIEIFYGKSYLMSFIGSVFVVIILFFKIIEIPLEVYTSALGYFEKIKKCTIIQSVINITLSISLIFIMGIDGVLLATIVSYIVGEFALYPSILNKGYFKEQKIKYYSSSSKLLLIALVSYLLLFFVTKNIIVKNLIQWFLLGILVFIINLLITTLYYKRINQLQFFDRVKKLIKDRRKKHEK